ncbi:MAG: HAMP domain-containing histidine kinase [Oligoflexia bacterium]|nr:HAMP domain-containing histidine kinase [Oligoflexia bacterium]MBF0364713.1 HAMP domain-containing histidine kinase [Oligoflexia bacterium]
MIRSPMFRKHYTVIAVIIILFIILGFLANLLIVNMIHQMRMSDQIKINPLPVFFAKLIDHLNSNDRPSALILVKKLHENSMPVYFAIVDDKGNIRYPKGDFLPFDWKKVNLPQKEYEHIPIDQDYSGKMPMPRGLVKFSGHSTEYLYEETGRKNFESSSLPPPPRPPHPFYPFPGSHRMGVFPILFLLLSVLLGVWMGLVLLFSSLQKNALLADSVIADLQNGNLKARFPIKKMDEVGQLMNRFNQMASEIERLVEQLRNVEKSRVTLLQELAHDLRTPITSLKNILETVSSKGSSLSQEVHDEMITLSLKEVLYFERLVEDLLVLAQTNEPKYHHGGNHVIINELVVNEIENMSTQYISNNKKINFTTDIHNEEIETLGDEHLLRRMFRNALENALSFAKFSVKILIYLSDDKKNVVISIEDDGNGFSQKALDSYGKRRVTRVLTQTSDGRASLGLGSVIMKTVTDVHHGNIEIGNIIDHDKNTIVGAKVKISLPVYSKK